MSIPPPAADLTPSRPRHCTTCALMHYPALDGQRRRCPICGTDIPADASHDALAAEVERLRAALVEIAAYGQGTLYRALLPGVGVQLVAFVHAVELVTHAAERALMGL